MHKDFECGSARLISITPDAEKVIAYCARVSNPKNQDNPNIEKLLSYCLRHKHWSIFETASMTVEVTCPLAIAVQMIRHRSMKFQQFSQRYQEVDFENMFYFPEIRLQDTKNRQNSLKLSEGLDSKIVNVYFQERVDALFKQTKDLYDEMLSAGIAKEVARFILPEGVMTKLYMTGDVRSFIHYIQVRTGEGVQLEHKQVALAVKSIFSKSLPIISKVAFDV